MTPNRKSEWALREVEFWGSIGCKVNQYEYPLQAVRDAWEKILLHQFHDILPGSSIARVYEEADQVYQDVLTNMEHALQQSLASYCTPGKSITVFNSLNWSRKALVPMPEGVNGGVDQQGKRLLGQKIEDNTYLEVALPACGWTTIQPADADEQDIIPISTNANTLENEYMKVVFNEYGEITSLYDKVSNQEFMAGNGKEGVSFARLGLAVVGEQHRFGVLQRSDLIRKGYDADVL